MTPSGISSSVSSSVITHQHHSLGQCDHSHEAPTTAVLMPDSAEKPMPSDHEGKVYGKETCCAVKGAVGDHKTLGYNNVFKAGVEALQAWFERSGLSFPSDGLEFAERKMLNGMADNNHFHVDADDNTKLAGQIGEVKKNDALLAGLCKQRNAAEDIVQKQVKALRGLMDVTEHSLGSKRFNWVELDADLLGKLNCSNRTALEALKQYLQEKGLQLNQKISKKELDKLLEIYNQQKDNLNASAESISDASKIEPVSRNANACTVIYKNLLKLQRSGAENIPDGYGDYIQGVLNEQQQLGGNDDNSEDLRSKTVEELIVQFRMILGDQVANDLESPERNQFINHNKQIQDLRAKFFGKEKCFEDLFNEKIFQEMEECRSAGSNKFTLDVDFIQNMALGLVKETDLELVTNADSAEESFKLQLNHGLVDNLNVFFEGLTKEQKQENNLYSLLQDIDNIFDAHIKKSVLGPNPDLVPVGFGVEPKKSNLDVKYNQFNEAKENFDGARNALLAYLAAPKTKNSAVPGQESVSQACLNAATGLVEDRLALEQQALGINRVVSIQADSLFLCPGKVKNGSSGAQTSVSNEGEGPKASHEKFREFSLHNASSVYYDGEDDTEYNVCYRLEFDQAGDAYKVFRYRLDGTRFKNTDGTEQEGIAVTSKDHLEQYFNNQALDALFADFKGGELQDYLKQQSFESIHARYQQGVNAYKKARDIACKPIMDVLKAEIKKKGILSVVGTGFSYNAALYGENDAINHRAVVAGLLFDMAMRGDIALHGSCGFQQNLIWWLRQPIIAVQDITGEQFLASKHGNDHHTVDDDATIHAIVPFTARSGLHEAVTVKCLKKNFSNKEIQARLVDSLLRSIRPLNVEGVSCSQKNLVGEGQLVVRPDGTFVYGKNLESLVTKTLDIVTPDGQTIFGHDGFQLDEASKSMLMQGSPLAHGTVLTLEHNIEGGLFDPQGDEFLENGNPITQRSKMQVAYNAQTQQFVLIYAQHWKLVPKAKANDPHAADIVDQDKSAKETVLCTFREIRHGKPFVPTVENQKLTFPDNTWELTQKPISSLFFVDPAYSRINCVHTQNGYGLLRDPGLANGQVFTVGTSVDPSPLPFTTAHILGATIDSNGTFSIALPYGLNSDQQAAILEDLEMYLGHMVVGTFNQHHSDMLQKEAGRARHPYKETDADALGDVDPEYAGHREGNLEIDKTGKHLRTIRTVLKDVKAFQRNGELDSEFDTANNLHAENRVSEDMVARYERKKIDPRNEIKFLYVEELKKSSVNLINLGDQATASNDADDTASGVIASQVQDIRAELSEIEYDLRKIHAQGMPCKDNAQVRVAELLTRFEDIEKQFASILGNAKDKAAKKIGVALERVSLFLDTTFLLRGVSDKSGTGDSSYSEHKANFIKFSSWLEKAWIALDATKHQKHLDEAVADAAKMQAASQKKSAGQSLTAIDTKTVALELIREASKDQSIKAIADILLQVKSELFPNEQVDQASEGAPSSGSRSRILTAHNAPASGASSSSSFSTESSSLSSSSQSSVNTSTAKVLSKGYTEFQVFQQLVRAIVGLGQKSAAACLIEIKELSDDALETLPEHIVNLELPIDQGHQLNMVRVLHKALANFGADKLSALLNMQLAQLQVDNNTASEIEPLAVEPVLAWEPIAQQLLHHYIQGQRAQELQAIFPAADGSSETSEVSQESAKRFVLPGDGSREFINRNPATRGFFSNVFKTPVWLRASVGMGGPLSSLATWVAGLAYASTTVSSYVSAGIGAGFSGLLGIMGIQLYREASKKIERLDALKPDHQEMNAKLEQAVLGVLNMARVGTDKLSSIEKVVGYNQKNARNDDEQEQSVLLSTLVGKFTDLGLSKENTEDLQEVLQHSIAWSQTQKSQLTLLERDGRIQRRTKRIGALFMGAGVSGVFSSSLSVLTHALPAAKLLAAKGALVGAFTTAASVAGTVVGGLLSLAGAVAIWDTYKQLKDAKLERRHIAVGNVIDSGVGRAGQGNHIQRIAELKVKLYKWIGFTGSSMAITVLGGLALGGVIGASGAASFGVIPAVALAIFVVALYVQHRRERNGKVLAAPENIMHTEAHNIPTDALKNRVVNRGNRVTGDLARFSRQTNNYLLNGNPDYNKAFNRKYYGASPNGWFYGGGFKKIVGVSLATLFLGRKGRPNGDEAAYALQAEKLAEQSQKDDLRVRAQSVDLMLRVVDIEENVLAKRIADMRKIFMQALTLKAALSATQDDNQANEIAQLQALLDLNAGVTEEVLQREELRLLEVQSLQNALRLFSSKNNQRLLPAEKKVYNLLRWRYLLLTDGLQNVLAPEQVHALLQHQSGSSQQPFMRVWYKGKAHVTADGISAGQKHQRVEVVYGLETAKVLQDFFGSNAGKKASPKERASIDQLFFRDALLHAPGREAVRMAAVLNTFLQQRLMNFDGLDRMVKERAKLDAEAQKSLQDQKAQEGVTEGDAIRLQNAKPRLKDNLTAGAWKNPFKVAVPA